MRDPLPLPEPRQEPRHPQLRYWDADDFFEPYPAPDCRCHWRVCLILCHPTTGEVLGYVDVPVLVTPADPHVPPYITDAAF